MTTENKETGVQVELWNNRRTQVLAHLTNLYNFITDPDERQRLIENNSLIFTEQHM